MKKAILTTVLILFVAVTLSACSSEKFPTGKFTRGDVALEFRDDGTYRFLGGEEVITEGTYTIQGDEMHIITDSYCDEENAGPATYKWQHEKDILKFELVGEDLCEGRRQQHTVNWFGPK